LNIIHFQTIFNRKDIIGTITETKIVEVTETKYMSIVLTTIGLFAAGMGIMIILSYLCSNKKPEDNYIKHNDSSDYIPNQQVNHSVEKEESKEEDLEVR